ncbi:hypothetical protein GCM10010399_41210 [Dactylosporangium fulvum]|uniref:Uncharacterized protein n=1 Tax=Dactylosporangium fulvum TaxID=53359 RepID=A0ABY5VYH8_9ACTN|nr:hypothetical protein [Dactylosporangium fulvum]UWP82317.1 hypothetical protein Dfulv_45925 [Dactylosporangium fulvum]
MSTVLALATVPFLMAAGLIALMKVPTHLQLTVTDTALIVEPQGLDRWWTRRERIQVPLTTVGSIRIVPRSEAPDLSRRHAGVHLDGIITAGVFGGTFWDVRRGDQLLMISCRPGSEFTTLVLQFANPFATLTRTRTVVAHKGPRSTSV